MQRRQASMIAPEPRVQIHQSDRRLARRAVRTFLTANRGGFIPTIAPGRAAGSGPLTYTCVSRATPPPSGDISLEAFAKNARPSTGEATVTVVVAVSDGIITLEAFAKNARPSTGEATATCRRRRQ